MALYSAAMWCFNLTPQWGGTVPTPPSPTVAEAAAAEAAAAQAAAAETVAASRVSEGGSQGGGGPSNGRPSNGRPSNRRASNGTAMANVVAEAGVGKPRGRRAEGSAAAVQGAVDEGSRVRVAVGMGSRDTGSRDAGSSSADGGHGNDGKVRGRQAGGQEGARVSSHGKARAPPVQVPLYGSPASSDADEGMGPVLEENAGWASIPADVLAEMLALDGLGRGLSEAEVRAWADNKPWIAVPTRRRGRPSRNP